METPHLIDVAIAIFLAYLAWKLRNVDAMRTDIAVIKSVVQGLPIQAMQEDIRSNRHKIAQLDKEVTEDMGKMGERITAIEQRCILYHKDTVIGER